MEADYDTLMQEYVRLFDTAYHQVSEKIAEDPSFEEMDAWLKNQDEALSQAMGPNIYDGISFTYKGGFARSWEYGDYSNYDPTTRDWYKTAERANGETAVVPPYVTFLDSQFADNESYILLSIVKKYNDEIYVDYVVKLSEVKAMLENRSPLYAGTRLLLFDAEGAILSSNNGKEYAHNINTPDAVISQSMSDSLKTALAYPDSLQMALVDGTPMFMYARQDEPGNATCMMIPLMSALQRDFMAIGIIVLFMVIFEVYLYRRNRNSLVEFKGRDDRLTAITNAAFDQRLYVDMDTMQFYGNDGAEQLYPDDAYHKLYAYFEKKVMPEAERTSFYDFVSPEALVKASGNMYTLETRKFTMDWSQPDGTTKPSVIEVGRLSSVIDGRETVGILCRDVSEDAAILKDALKQAESASRAKGDFMSRMSHEIRTPLNAVIGYLDIAKDEKADPQKVEHCLDQSSVAARHLLAIINDVLDISSIESGRMKIESEDFDLTQMVHSLTTVFYAQAKKKDVRFEVSISDLTEEWVRGDSLRVNQIMLNLLSNAVKFTSEGGEVRLDIKQIGIHEGKVHLQFKVSDSGIGMSQEYLGRLFKPFEQESASTARVYGGTGLGLSICYNLVKMMGGNISVASEQGKGTVFTVMLAFDESDQKTSAHLTTESFSKLRALVVDDEESACEYI